MKTFKIISIELLNSGRFKELLELFRNCVPDSCTDTYFIIEAMNNYSRMLEDYSQSRNTITSKQNVIVKSGFQMQGQLIMEEIVKSDSNTLQEKTLRYTRNYRPKSFKIFKNKKMTNKKLSTDSVLQSLATLSKQAKKITKDNEHTNTAMTLYDEFVAYKKDSYFSSAIVFDPKNKIFDELYKKYISFKKEVSEVEDSSGIETINEIAAMLDSALTVVKVTQALEMVAAIDADNMDTYLAMVDGLKKLPEGFAKTILPQYAEKITDNLKQLANK